MKMIVGVRFKSVFLELQIQIFDDKNQICENCDKILSFVLGEGNKLLGIFMDKDLEFLFFFIIFCGKCRIDNKDGKILLLYSIVVKQEL